jgi:hypothetical protein
VKARCRVWYAEGMWAATVQAAKIHAAMQKRAAGNVGGSSQVEGVARLDLLNLLERCMRVAALVAASFEDEADVSLPSWSALHAAHVSSDIGRWAILKLNTSIAKGLRAPVPDMYHVVPIKVCSPPNSFRMLLRLAAKLSCIACLLFYYCLRIVLFEDRLLVSSS